MTRPSTPWVRHVTICCVLSLLLPAIAWAQDSAIVATPSAIPGTPLPPLPAPPSGLVQTPAPPADADTGVPAAPPAPPANNWVAGTTARIGVLDKIDGTVSEVTIATGGQSTIGDLQISVQACVNRPADELPDTAIFLTAQPAAAGAAPLYRGWMVRSIPGAAVVGDASETFRVISCS